MKVVLNGGKSVLDDATVPFQIAFDASVAKNNPTHILVIDVTNTGFYDNGERKQDTSNAERSVFKLEPTNYLQFHKPGVHHLIFMLVSGGMDKICKQQFLGKVGYSYKNEMQYGAIEKNEAVPGQITFLEVIVEVPKEFFAKAPETKFGQAFQNWNNRWYDLSPIDQCQYRKRILWSLPIPLKPLLWLILCIPRIIVAVLLALVMLTFRTGYFLFGIQFVHFFSSNAKFLLIDFMLLYTEEWSSVFKDYNWKGDEFDYGKTAKDSTKPMDTYAYKIVSIFGYQFYTPITIVGFVVYVILLAVYAGNIEANLPGHIKNPLDAFLMTIFSFVLSFAFGSLFAFCAMPTIKKDAEYQDRWDREEKEGIAKMLKVFWWISLSMSGLALLEYFVFQVSWPAVFHALISIVSIVIMIVATFGTILFILTRNKLWKPVGKIVWKMMKPIVWILLFLNKLTFEPLGKLLYFLFKEKEQKPVVVKSNSREAWLERSFKLETLPAKVDVFKAPEPSTKVHKFRIGFMNLKAKVCKPYAKG